MKSLLTLSFVFLSLLSSPSNAQEEGNPFRLRMDPDEIVTRLRSVASAIDRVKENAANPASPSVGVRVGGVYPRGNADVGGIERGSLIIKRGDYFPWSGFAPEIPISKPHFVKYIDPDGNEEKVMVGGGPIGATLSKSYSLGTAFLRGEVGSKNRDWDEELIAACIFCQSDQALAESVMHFAVENGYPLDDLVDFLAVQFQTYSPSGPDEAIDRFLGHFQKDEAMPWVYLPPLHEAAVVTGRIDLMTRIAKEAGLNCVFDEDTISKFLKWTGGETRFPQESLLQRAIANRGESIAHRFTSTEIESRRGDRPGPPLDGHIDVSRDPGETFNVEYTSDDIPHNIHYHLKADLKATGEKMRGRQTRLLLLLASLYKDPHDIPQIEKYSMASPSLDRRVLYLELNPVYSFTGIETSGSSLPGINQTYHGIAHLPYVNNPDLPDHLQGPFDASNGTWSRETGPITIDMIRYGCEVGIYVNGICVLHLPTDPNSTRKVDFNLHSTAIEIESEEQNMWELIDKD